MITNYQTEATAELAQEILKAGFRVFIAERGTYGFYTDEEGTRVVSFHYGLGGFDFSGNYKAVHPHGGRNIGTGWVLRTASFDNMFGQYPLPSMVGNTEFRIITMAQHLERYQSSSRFTEVVADDEQDIEGEEMVGDVCYRNLAMSQGFDIKDTDEGYTWSARNFVMDSASEFDTEQEAWENIKVNFPNIED